MTPLSEVGAHAVYDLLAAHAGASDNDDARSQFVYHLTHGCTEYRFMGGLGFGGKLYVEPQRLRVGAYPEDVKRWPAMQLMIETTNRALAELTKEKS